MSTLVKDGTAPTIAPLRAVPEVAASMDRKADFLQRLAACDQRRAELKAELATKRKRADPALVGAQLRAGEAIDFAGEDTAALEREIEALSAEGDALVEAGEQEQLVLSSATAAATEVMLMDLTPHLGQLDRRAAVAFAAFSAARELRFDVAKQLTAAGYPELARDVAASGIMPQMGTASESESPMAPTLRHLADRGLIKV